MTTIESNTKLLKFHLRWPQRKVFESTEEEALEFFKWMFLNHYEVLEPMQIDSVEGMVHFLKKNRRLLKEKSASSSEPTAESNARLEPRIDNDFKVILRIDECKSATDLVGMVATGRTVDIGLHGMRILVSKKVPEGALVSLSLQAGGGEGFELLALVKWSDVVKGEQLLGLEILDSAGFGHWHAEFGAKFVAPKIARVPVALAKKQELEVDDSEETV